MEDRLEDVNQMHTKLLLGIAKFDRHRRLCQKHTSSRDVDELVVGKRLTRRYGGNGRLNIYRENRGYSYMERLLNSRFYVNIFVAKRRSIKASNFKRLLFE